MYLKNSYYHHYEWKMLLERSRNPQVYRYISSMTWNLFLKNNRYFLIHFFILSNQLHFILIACLLAYSRGYEKFISVERRRIHMDIRRSYILWDFYTRHITEVFGSVLEFSVPKVKLQLHRRNKLIYKQYSK